MYIIIIFTSIVSSVFFVITSIATIKHIMKGKVNVIIIDDLRYSLIFYTIMSLINSITISLTLFFRNIVFEVVNYNLYVLTFIYLLVFTPVIISSITYLYGKVLFKIENDITYKEYKIKEEKITINKVESKLFIKNKNEVKEKIKNINHLFGNIL